MISSEIYLFQDAFRCAVAQFGVVTNHPEFVGLGTIVTSTPLAHEVSLIGSMSKADAAENGGH